MNNSMKFLVSITIFLTSSVGYIEESASSQTIIEEKLENSSETAKNSEKKEQFESIPDEIQDNTNTENIKSELTPEELERYEKFLQADQLYLEGKMLAAEKLYRELKPPFEAELKSDIEEKVKPIYDPQKLDSVGAVYWKMYQQGLEHDKFLSKRLVPLKLLVDQRPHFIPGYIHYAEVLESIEQDEEALIVLQQALNLYPNNAQLLRAKIEENEEEERWLEAAISAHQFAMFNPDHPQTDTFKQLAQENLDRYRDKIKSDLTWKAIGNVVTAGLSYALTGSYFGPVSALETIMVFLQGESSVGDRIAGSIKKKLPMVKDEEIVSYVREVGNKLAKISGRDDLDYEFYVIKEKKINAFALPGGKIFVNAGAIAETNSEAELAGLLAHELSHAILSHSFQMVAQSNLTSNIVLFIPYVGNTASNLLVLNYSREMETEADVLGTKLLAASGYAADGVRNLMIKIDEQEEKEDSNRPPPAWLSTHPESENRVEYLEELIVSNKLNRYRYEGIERHWRIKQKVKQLLTEFEKQQEEKK